jgi:hypothetical protein
MFAETNGRSGLIRALYGANIVGAGIPGALITFAPTFAETTLLWGPQDPALLSIVGSIWLAIGLASFLGLFAPFRFLAIFVVQLFYKTIWLTSFVLPAALSGELRPEAWILVGIFLFLIVAVLLIVPRRAVFGAVVERGAPISRTSQVGGQR